jgi:hypothetical protein
MHVPYNLQPPVKNCHMLSNFAALQNLQTEGTKKKAVINIFDEINNIRMKIIQLQEQDKKFMDIQAVIESKRNMLINKQQKMSKIAKQNGVSWGNS